MAIVAPSDRAVFRGFEAYFDDVIAPYLAEKERDRVEAVAKSLIAGAAAAALAMAVAAFAPFGSANIQFAVIIGCAGVFGAAWIVDRARADITHGLLEKIAGELGFRYSGEMERPPYYDRFRRLKLLPGHNREKWEDEVRGEHAGNPFLLCEAHLKVKSSGKNSSARTVFHGQLFVIDYAKRSLGTTVVLRDGGLLNAIMKPGPEFQRVGLASPAFERAFEAWSTDQVEARDLLDPVVLERFQELERLYNGKKLRAAFDDGKLLIAIETGDRFNIGTMFAPINGADRVNAILKEFDVVFDLVDVVLKRVEQPTGGAFTLADVKAR
jgi:hypothetical protein